MIRLREDTCNKEENNAQTMDKLWPVNCLQHIRGYCPTLAGLNTFSNDKRENKA
jgi:hypothetical protein